MQDIDQTEKLQQLIEAEQKLFKDQADQHQRIIAGLTHLREVNLPAWVNRLYPFGYCADYAVSLQITALEDLTKVISRFKPMPLIRIVGSTLTIKPLQYVRESDLQVNTLGIALDQPFIVKKDKDGASVLQWWATFLDEKTICISVSSHSVDLFSQFIPNPSCDRFQGGGVTYWNNWLLEGSPEDSLVKEKSGFSAWEEEWATLKQTWGCVRANDHQKANRLRVMVFHTKNADVSFFVTEKQSIEQRNANLFDLDSNRFTDKMKQELITHVNGHALAFAQEEAKLQVAKNTFCEILRDQGFYFGSDSNAVALQNKVLTCTLAKKGVSATIAYMAPASKSSSSVNVRLVGNKGLSSDVAFVDFVVDNVKALKLLLPDFNQITAMDEESIEQFKALSLKVNKVI